METEANGFEVVESIWAEAAEGSTQNTEGETDSGETETSDQTTEEVETEGVADNGEGEAESTDDSIQDSESEDEPALPEKQAKTYSKELVDSYAKRFGVSPEDVVNNKSLAFAIKKAIDSDIFIAQQNALIESLKQSQEAVDEESAEDAETEQATEQPKPTPEQRAQYLDNLARFTKEITDPDMADQYARDWCKAQGVDFDRAVKGGFNPQEFTEGQTKYAVNLINTVLPRLLPSMLGSLVESVFPGFGNMYSDALNANTWEELRGDAAFKALPSYGSPDFKSTVDAVMKANPWIAQMTMTDPKTQRPLSKPEQIRAQYRVTMQIASGQKVTPETVKKAVETGRKEAQGHARRVSVSKSLGAGKSKGDFQAPKKDDFKDAILAYNQSKMSGESK